MKTISALFLCVVWMATACAQGGFVIKDDDAAAVRAADLTTKYHLTKIPTLCLYFDTVDEGDTYLVRVREKHSKACGGDPETTNTVFFLRVRKRDGRATTTAYNTEGVFQELRPLRSKSRSEKHH
jgi:hypothetical protein